MKSSFVRQVVDSLADELPPLRSCPFCGGHNVEIEGVVSVNVVCSHCEAEGPNVSSREKLDPHTAIKQAVERWNSRP